MPSDQWSHFSVSRSLPFHPFLFSLLHVPIHTYTLLLLCLDGGPTLYDIQHYCSIHIHVPISFLYGCAYIFL